VACGSAELDLREPEQVVARLREHAPQLVLNAAAYTAVDAAEKDEAAAAQVNAHAPQVLARECARTGALLVHYSTDYVFDGEKREPYREDDPPAPVSAYGRTKLAGEQAIRASGCPHLILRTSWVYAARGRNFVLTMLRLARERPELRVVADQVGSPTWAGSIARATWDLVGKKGQMIFSGTYNVTNAGQVSWHGFAQAIVARGAELGLCPAVPVRAITSAEYPTPARRPGYSVLAGDRLAADFGIRLPDWQAALAQCMAEIAAPARA
jgi:dTDP-4-dehydrorhamnose reductase